MIKWRKYIVDQYVKNLEFNLSDQWYDQEYLTNFNFDEEEQAYLDSRFDLNEFLNSGTPLIDILNKGKIDLACHLMNFTKIKVNVNEVKADQTLFTSCTNYFLKYPEEDLKENYLRYQEEIYHHFINGYKAKEEDFEYMKQFKGHISSRKHQYIMFASYALKLDDSQLIHSLKEHIRLITSLTCIKTGKHIGFYKSIEDQVLKSTHPKSSYQNYIISYINRNHLSDFKNLKSKLLDMRLNIHEVISDQGLKKVLSRLRL